jgi:hypothetical protein
MNQRRTFGGADLATLAVVGLIWSGYLHRDDLADILDSGGLDAVLGTLFSVAVVAFAIWAGLSMIWLLAIRPLIERVGLLKPDEKSG